MARTWISLVEHVLRPARRGLAPCSVERDAWRLSRSAAHEVRQAALARVAARIEERRAEVFAAKDGVVGASMTLLEREWRQLSRVDHDGEAMDLWARLVPPPWIDRKRFRDVEPSARAEMAFALASDLEGIEEAEVAVDALRRALSALGTTIGPVVRYRPFTEDFTATVAWLDRELERARAALPAEAAAIVLARAEEAAAPVRAAATARFPERGALVAAIVSAAVVEAVARATGAPAGPSAALRALWLSGYTIAAADETGTTLEVAPLALPA